MIPKKKWFIKVDGEVEGPYSFRELKQHPDVTPDTLAKKEGWSTWQPIRTIEELSSLFEDKEEDSSPNANKVQDNFLGEIVLDARQEPPQFVLWLVLALILVLYLLYQTQGM